jgi:hypothetical protein
VGCRSLWQASRTLSVQGGGWVPLSQPSVLGEVLVRQVGSYPAHCYLRLNYATLSYRDLGFPLIHIRDFSKVGLRGHRRYAVRHHL